MILDGVKMTWPDYIIKEKILSAAFERAAKQAPPKKNQTLTEMFKPRTPKEKAGPMIIEI